MKKLSKYISESNYDVPLDEIIDSKGRVLAKIPYFTDPRDYVQHSYCRFVFRTVGEMNDFKNTTFSREFWLEIYGYDSVGLEQNDWVEISKEMSKFANLSIGKEIIVYALDERFKDELFERCKQVEKEYDFKKVEYIEK